MTMKKIGILLFIFLPVIAFCSTTGDSTKTTASDSTKTKKLVVGISFSPDYCFRKLKPEEDAKWIAESRDSIEVAKFGYSVGAVVEYKLNSKLHIAAGVQFSDSGEKTKKFTVDDLPYGQKAVSYSYNFHHHYLNIPVKANYFLLTGKLKFYVTLGVSTNVFLSQRTTFITHYANRDSKEISKTDPGFSKINFAVLAGCGITYPINSKTKLMIEPIYRRSINSIIKAPVKSYLYSGGVNVGILLDL